MFICYAQRISSAQLSLRLLTSRLGGSALNDASDDVEPREEQFN